MFFLFFLFFLFFFSLLALDVVDADELVSHAGLHVRGRRIGVEPLAAEGRATGRLDEGRGHRGRVLLHRDSVAVVQALLIAPALGDGRDEVRAEVVRLLVLRPEARERRQDALVGDVERVTRLELLLQSPRGPVLVLLLCHRLLRIRARCQRRRGGHRLLQLARGNRSLVLRQLLSRHL